MILSNIESKTPVPRGTPSTSAKQHHAPQKTSPPPVETATRAAMQISYLCATKQQDVLSLRKDQILDDGIFIQQGKTGKKQIKLWSPELREAVKECDNVYGVNSLYVIHQATGSSFTRDGFNSR